MEFESLHNLDSLRIAEVVRDGSIGGYELTEAERALVLLENKQRGTLPLIEARNRSRENFYRKDL